MNVVHSSDVHDAVLMASENLVEAIKSLKRRTDQATPTPPSSASKRMYVAQTPENKVKTTLDLRHIDRSVMLERHRQNMLIDCKRDKEPSTFHVRGVSTYEVEHPVLLALDLQPKARELKAKAVDLAKSHEYRPSLDGFHLGIMAIANLLVTTLGGAVGRLDSIIKMSLSKG